MRQGLSGPRNAARAFSASEEVADFVLRGERWLVDCTPVGREGLTAAQLEPEFDQLQKRQHARHLQKAQLRRAAKDIALDVDEAVRRDFLGKVARYGADGATPSLLGREYVNGPVADRGEPLRQTRGIVPRDAEGGRRFRRRQPFDLGLAAQIPKGGSVG